MPGTKIVCFIDARQSPEYYSFQKAALLRAFESYSSKVDFLALVQSREASAHVGPIDVTLVADEVVTFGALLREIGSRATGASWVVFSEPNVYPDAGWAEELSRSSKRSLVSFPAHALTLDVKSQLVQSHLAYRTQTAASASSDWLTSLRFCFAIPAVSLPTGDSTYDRVLLGDLRESLIHAFRSAGLPFVPARQSQVFSVRTHGEMPVLKIPQAAYFSRPKRPPARARVGMAVDELAKKALSSQQRYVKLTQNLSRAIAENAEFDVRWSRMRPVTELVGSPEPYFPEEFVFKKICASVSKADYVVVLHQLRRGGSEKEGLLHIQAYREIHPDHKIYVVLTSPIEPDLEWRLPDGVTLLELGKEWTSLQLDHFGRSFFLYRVIDHLEPRFVHVKGSDIGWRTLFSYGRALACKMKILANLYCVDYQKDGTAASFGFHDLVQSARDLQWLLADNQHLLDQMQPLARVPTKKISYPVPLPEKSWQRHAGDDDFRVLWCSRLTLQKDVKLLLRIAATFPDFEFHVYGEQSDDKPYVEAFRSLSNVKYWGLFDDLDELDLGRFDCFFYTSFWDGLPNVLLEAGVHGIPVVSPAVGGIGEILTDQNAFIYRKPEDLVAIFCDWSKRRAQKLGAQLRKDIAANHKWDRFIEDCRVIYGS